jgi:hypothetical protein
VNHHVDNVELRSLHADPVEGNWYEATIGGGRIEE